MDGGWEMRKYLHATCFENNFLEAALGNLFIIVIFCSLMVVWILSWLEFIIVVDDVCKVKELLF